MVSRRTAINGSILALCAIAAAPTSATVLTFNNSRSDGQKYVGSYSDPTDPLSTYGTAVNFGTATTGTTTVVQNASNTDTFNYQIGNGWTPHVSTAYSVGPAPAVDINYASATSAWPNGAAQLAGSGSNDPNDDFYFSFTPAPGYAVRINSYTLVAGYYDDIRTNTTVYENTIGGTEMVPTFGPTGIYDGPGNTSTFDLQHDYGSVFFAGTVILDVHQSTGMPADIGITNLNFDEEYLASPGEWAIASSNDWNVGTNWGGATVPNGVGASALLGAVITSAQTVYSNSAITLGSLTFNNANKYVLAGAGSLTLQASSGNAAVNVSQGTQEINLPTTLASNAVFNVSTGANLIIADPLTINSGKSLTTSGGGTVTYESILTVQSNAAITFADSTIATGLSVGSKGTANITSPNGGVVLEVDSLSNGGTIDIQNNKLIVNYASGSDPIATIKAEIASGYANGAWTGTGIMSTTAQTNSGSYGIGYADSADPGNPAGLASGTIEVVYTLLGDANLDGAVNGSDFAILATNFNKAVSGWDQGDFNYDGSVNGADFADLAANFNQSANGSDTAALNAFAAVNGLTADVPEPVSMGLFMLGAIGMFTRRRRIFGSNRV
jgi:hypothetical protein